MKWFTIPLLLFLGFGLISMIQKINDIVLLKEKKIKEGKAAQIVMTTCPEYWVRETVTIDPQPGVSDESKTVEICRNYFDHDGTPHYVGGSGNGDANSKFSMNFREDDSNIKPFSDTINSLQDKATYILQEGFVGDDLDVSDPDLGTTYVNSAEGVHIHHMSPIVVHDHTDAMMTHDHVHGKHPHNHQNVMPGPVGNNINKSRPFEHGENWINKTTDNIHPNGVEINLSKLNEAENKCDLTKMFHWTEAFEKC